MANHINLKYDNSDLFKNEPIRDGEAGNLQPIREAEVGGVNVRIFEDLYATVGSFTPGKTAFRKSIRTYGQIIGLLSALESFAVGSGTYENGFHSKYPVEDLEFVGDKIVEFAYVRFSKLSAARRTWLSKHGVKDDGNHGDRWVTLTAENGKLFFGYIVHPRTNKEYLAHLKEVFNGENGKRLVESFEDVNRLDWNANDKAWAQQNRHDGIELVLNALSGKQIVRVSPTLYERTDGRGLSVQDQAEYIADRYLKLFASAEEIKANREERVQSALQSDRIKGTVHVMKNLDRYDGFRVHKDMDDEIATGSVTIIVDGEPAEVPADSLISERGATVRLTNCYADGESPVKGTFVVWNVDELRAAMNIARERDLFIRIAA